MVGLGRMGGNMAERLRGGGHEVVGYDRDPNVSEVGSLADLVAALPKPAVVWVMVPSGEPTRATIGELGKRPDPVLKVHARFRFDTFDTLIWLSVENRVPP